MKPTLLAFRLGDAEIALPTYGVAVTLGIALAILLAARQAPRLGLDRGEILDLSWWLLVTGLAGSRLLFVLLDAGSYARLCAGGDGVERPFAQLLRDCAAPLRIWDGGLVFYGGAIAAGLFAWRFARRRGWSFPLLGDLYAPGVALGHAVGRLGCFAAGCCFGKVCPTARPCLAFPEGSLPHDHFVTLGQLANGVGFTPPLHPTQLYESAALLLLFFALRALTPRKRFHGQVFLFYVVGYAAIRFLLELYRGDVTRHFVLEWRAPALATTLGLPANDPLLLSTGQLVSLALLVGALAAGLWRRSRLRGAQAGAGASA